MLGRNHVLYVVFMLMPAYHPPIIVLKLEEASHSRNSSPSTFQDIHTTKLLQSRLSLSETLAYLLPLTSFIWYIVLGLIFRTVLETGVCLHHSDNRCQSSGTGRCTVWLRSGRQIHTAKYHQILHPKINILLNKWKYAVNTTKVWLGLTEVTMQFISETDCI